MKFKFSLSKKEKPKKPNLAIDIGTEAVKAFVFSDSVVTDSQIGKAKEKGEEIKKSHKEIKLHATSIGYFDNFQYLLLKILKKNYLKEIF